MNESSRLLPSVCKALTLVTTQGYRERDTFAEQDDDEPPKSVRMLEEQIRSAGQEVMVYAYAGTGH